MQNKTGLSEDEQKIRNEQTRLLYGTLPSGIIAILINSLLLVVVQWDVLDHGKLLVWLAFAVLITLARLFLTRLYRARHPGYEASSSWLLYFNIGAVFASLVWMLAVIFLFPRDDLVHQAFLAFVIAGMSAGAVSSLSFALFPIRAYLVLALLPLIVQFFLEGTKSSFAMGAMISLFLGTVWVSSYRNYQNILQNIRLRFESDSREQALRESEARYRLILDSAPVGIVHFDRKGQIVTSNRTFSELVGKTEPGGGSVNLLTGVHSLAIADQVKAALQGGSGYFVGRISDFFGGAATPVRVYLRGISAGGEMVGGVGIFEDISEDQRLDRMKNEFISTVSHELRTPLTSIHGSLGLVIGDMKDQVSDSVLSLLEIASRNTDRLLLLINDILDISRIEAGRLEMRFERIEVFPFMQHVLQVNEAYGFQYSVGFQLQRTEHGLTVMGDRNRLMQVFTNLLSNAAKFSNKNSKVDISFYRKNSRVCFEVRDYGRGIPPAFHARVFEKFAQYDASDSRSSGGTGLGLSITKGIIEQHHGTIDFESRVGEGATFYVELPVVE